MTMHAVAGLDTEIYLPDNVQFLIRLIPVGLQRPGIPLWSNRPKYIQHETDNERDGANAVMHNNWLMNGARDGAGNPTQTSFHFVVDGGIAGQSGPGREGTIIQNVPCGEVTWQAADGFGPGNYDCHSCELCVNRDGDETRARRNMEYLAAAILKATNQEADALGTHWKYNFANDPALRHHCPEHMLFEAPIYWPTALNNVAQILHPAPAPYVSAKVPDWWSDSELMKPEDRIWNRTLLRYCHMTYTAAKDVVYPRAWASNTAPLTRKPLKIGETFTGVYRFKAGGKWWIMTKYGTRILASHCTPWVTMTEPAT